MTERATLFLEPTLLKSAKDREHNFLNHVIGVLTDGGYRVDLRPDHDGYRPEHGRALTHMSPPPPGGLCFRRVYHYPFWAIEQTSERWHWSTAKSAYLPDLVPDTEARGFHRRWRDRVFPRAATATRDGFVYVPLQGRLLDHRSFQSCSPLDMLRHTLAADPTRPVIATLHPKEHYSEAELTALRKLATHPRLTLRTGGMEALLHGCDYVVSMTSAAAFNAIFFGKPCILFGQIDFHHIMLSARPDDLSAFDRIADHAPDHARYLWWFWQHQSINAGRPEVRDRIRAALQRCGWPISG
ncbi:hypothetical protein [Pseudooceanicola onchidii]|uniref:hypothetical protein n=1 Tax=Pseudooceanicola onchidii TaxID=2562279 RepID=UPI0010AAED52|nr:hypothetical protein [Pseudooceanicola onchidii]